MPLRRPKVITTDFREADRKTAATSASIKQEHNSHDKAIEGYDLDLCASVYNDLSNRGAWNRKDPEQRFIMERSAAVARRIMKLKPQAFA